MNFNGEQYRAVLIYAILCFVTLTGKVTFCVAVCFIESYCYFRRHSAFHF